MRQKVIQIGNPDWDLFCNNNPSARPFAEILIHPHVESDRKG
jgi:hypothetical protein